MTNQPTKLFVSNKDESVRMFKNPILDAISKVHWSVPLIFWMPINIFCVYYSISVYQLPMLPMIGLMVAAFFVWTVAEYILHRFVFHFHPKSEFGKRILFITHGVHHDYPNDSRRLVMPPALACILAIPFVAIFYYGLYPWHLAFFAGFNLGYLTYDMMHYAFHHAQFENGYFKRMKEHHMMHHYAEPDLGFGVSSIIWDIVFGTTIKTKK